MAGIRSWAVNHWHSVSIVMIKYSIKYGKYSAYLLFASSARVEIGAWKTDPGPRSSSLSRKIQTSVSVSGVMASLCISGTIGSEMRNQSSRLASTACPPSRSKT